ncbi:Glycerol-3-phosphate dehydrogenase [Georgfuchsia toluolica]|uniref:Glycerol-3-phosphate dehydrogenase n=1 Tax=Georgfuchsia toluolica TaxID=424218 RepID=A0A916J4J4_9PROT|nr:glycerol-3-phosphate dehydrogenase [Georgfuchsia toluolica]CAG4883832.1 Glycerol-3-phosphate dehydrogenase [Georgfuchsia toluolica]
MSDPARIHDLLIVGGGINGAGIARDAAGRGLAVALCEKGDIAGATSWASSKLIHGGLRYLEHYDFRLVRESLQEREILLRIAPHLTHPLRFVMPHSSTSRPAWLIGLGLWLYDHLGGAKTLPPSAAVAFADSPYGAPLQAACRNGHVYSDVQTNDARLTIENVRDAAHHGASILPRTRLLSARRENGIWVCTLRTADALVFDMRFRAIANAAGPWAARMHTLLGGREDIGIQLVRGSHIVVPRLYAGDHAYTLQNDDGRIVFLLPFHDNFTLIGTTEVRVRDPDELPAASTEEVAYLCRATNRYLRNPIRPQDAVWTFAGVRPLLDDGKENLSQVSREYRFVLDQPRTGDAPLLTIIGGKLTTYRRLAEKALDRLAPTFPKMAPAWTAQALLPDRMIDSGADPGCDFGGGLCERDVRYFIEQEWAHDADDIMWRRTKAGLSMNRKQRDEFTLWLERNR